MTRVLCTGVAGFMASHLSRDLANEGYEVLGIDNESIGRRENVPDNIKYLKLDLRDRERTREVVKSFKPDVVFHAAAWAHEGLSQFMPLLITDNNYVAYLNLLIPSINSGMRKMVLFSSMSVYGDQTPPFDESLRKSPADIYAASKASMEDATETLADVHGFDYTIVRPHNIYGEGQSLHDPYRNVVGIMMNRIMRNLPPIIYGDGTQTRAFSYIGDVEPYILRTGFDENTNGEIINIGPTEEFTINHLAEVILKAFGREDLVPIYMPDRPREVKHAFCTNQKAIELLGYETKFSLEEGIKRMSEWAKKQGPQEFQYLEDLELKGDKLPQTWKDHLL